jgi:hypothetical protein
MTAYSGKEGKHATPSMTPTDANVIRLTAKTENVGHKVYTDNSSPELFYDLCTKTIKPWGAVTPNRKVMPKTIGPKKKLKQGYTQTRGRRNLTAIVWKDN